MSLDVGDVIEGLCRLIELGPFKVKPHWPLWRRNLWFFLRLAWLVSIGIVIFALIMALVK